MNEQEATGGPAPWERGFPSPEDIVADLLTEKKLLANEASDAFLGGLRDRLQEIEKALSK